MLQCAANFSVSCSAKQIGADNFGEGLLWMGFKRSCLLTQSRSFLMLVFLLSLDFYVPFNHTVLFCLEGKRKTGGHL